MRLLWKLPAMFVNEGVTLDTLALQPNRPGMDSLLSGQVDADYGYMTSEPFSIHRRGVTFTISNRLLTGWIFTAILCLPVNAT